MIQAFNLDGSTWHLLKHRKIKLVCESLEQLRNFLGRFDMSVSRFQVWTVGPAGSRHRGQSSELGALSATHGQRHPSALGNKMCFFSKKCLYKNLPNSICTFALLFYVRFFQYFSHEFRCAVDIRPCAAFADP